MPNLSEKIAGKIRSSVNSGRYRYGDRLPSIIELAGIFKSSPVTIQKSINILKKEDILDSKPGTGLTVKAVSKRKNGNRKVLLLTHFLPSVLAKAGEYPAVAVESLRESLRENSYSLSILSIGELDEFSIVNEIKMRNPQMIAMLEIDNDHLISEIRNSKLPIISMDYNACRMGVPSVYFDNLWAGFLATRHLIDNGHRLIAAFDWEVKRQIGNNLYEDMVTSERINGYRIAMINCDLVPMVVHMTEEMNTKAKLFEVFGSRPSPTAIFCYNYAHALNLYKKLSEMGFDVPRDVSIIHTGNESGKMADRKYSFVKTDCMEMGRSAAEMIINYAKDESLPASKMLPVSLETGDSVMNLKKTRKRMAI